MTNNECKPIDVLLVEDDPINRTLMEGFLDDPNLSLSQLTSVESLEQALTFLQEHECDVILLDLNLPDSKELEALYATIQQASHTAVIVITGEYGEELGLQAIAGGAQDYLIKASFDQSMLRKSIFYAMERKEMEKARERDFRELQQAHADLKSMQAQLLQNEKLAAIGRLAAGVAHEINTPVGFVASNVETLNRYMGNIRQLLEHYGELVEACESLGNNDLQQKIGMLNRARQELKIDIILEDFQCLVSESQEGLQSVFGIVQNLRDFSLVDQVNRVTDYDLNEGLEAMLALERNTIDDNISIVTELAECPFVQCNASQINQAIHNILMNAVQAIDSPQQEGKGTITIRSFATEQDLVCTISDDGIGIPEDEISKIFEPFFTTREVGKGIGLGLSLAYDIVVLKHNGQLTVESEVGKGTTVSIHLPCKTRNDCREPVGSLWEDGLHL